jgi:hypothetical protein
LAVEKKGQGRNPTPPNGDLTEASRRFRDRFDKAVNIIKRHLQTAAARLYRTVLRRVEWPNRYPFVIVETRRFDAPKVAPEADFEGGLQTAPPIRRTLLTSTWCAGWPRLVSILTPPDRSAFMTSPMLATACQVSDRSIPAGFAVLNKSSKRARRPLKVRD